MKKAYFGILTATFLLFVTTAFAQNHPGSAAQDMGHYIQVVNNSSQDVIITANGGNCMTGMVLQASIPSKTSAWPIKIHADEPCVIGHPHFQFQVLDLNNNSLGYISATRPGETFHTYVNASGANAAKIQLNRANDQRWQFVITNR